MRHGSRAAFHRRQRHLPVAAELGRGEAQGPAVRRHRGDDEVKLGLGPEDLEGSLGLKAP